MSRHAETSFLGASLFSISQRHHCRALLSGRILPLVHTSHIADLALQPPAISVDVPLSKGTESMRQDSGDSLSPNDGLG